MRRAGSTPAGPALRGLSACSLVALALMCAPAGAQTLLPPGNDLLTGLTGGSYPSLRARVGTTLNRRGCGQSPTPRSEHYRWITRRACQG